MDDIKMALEEVEWVRGVDWINLAQGGDTWRAVA
jgi:hypothetical protein